MFLWLFGIITLIGTPTTTHARECTSTDAMSWTIGETLDVAADVVQASCERGREAFDRVSMKLQLNSTERAAILLFRAAAQQQCARDIRCKAACVGVKVVSAVGPYVIEAIESELENLNSNGAITSTPNNIERGDTMIINCFVSGWNTQTAPDDSWTQGFKRIWGNWAPDMTVSETGTMYDTSSNIIFEDVDTKRDDMCDDGFFVAGLYTLDTDAQVLDSMIEFLLNKYARNRLISQYIVDTFEDTPAPGEIRSVWVSRRGKFFFQARDSYTQWNTRICEASVISSAVRTFASVYLMLVITGIVCCVSSTFFTAYS